MPKRATQVVLSEKEQEALTRISRRYRSEQQAASRARSSRRGCVLKASDQWSGQ